MADKARYVVNVYRDTPTGDLVPSRSGKATTRKEADRLAKAAREMAMPGTVFRYPLITLARIGGETLAEWRLGRDHKHHAVDPGSTPDRIGPRV